MSGLLLSVVIIFFFVRLPQAVAESLVSRHPDYFLLHEAAWKKENSLATQFGVKLLEFKLRQDIKALNLQRLAVDEEKPDEMINLLVEDLRRNYITKLQATVPVITNSTFASFVRGYGFCDHTNACLAFMLTGAVDDVAMIALSDANMPPHSVVRVKSDLGTVYADAFTCTNVFGFEEEMSARGKAVIPTYKQLQDELYPPVSYHQGQEFNRFNTAYTFQKAFRRLGQVVYTAAVPAAQPQAAAAKSAAKEVDLAALAEKKAIDSVYALHAREPRSLKVLFLQARINHLYDEIDQARSLYQAVVASAPPQSLLASYARLFLARLDGANQPCNGQFNYNHLFSQAVRLNP